MRYYVEVVVMRNDGVERWTRTRYKDYDEAKAVAKFIAEEAFREQVDDFCEYQLGVSPVLQNDFGEMTLIRATAFGEMANVREGEFAL
jgi:hypothetical protein